MRLTVWEKCDSRGERRGARAGGVGRGNVKWDSEQVVRRYHDEVLDVSPNSGQTGASRVSQIAPQRSAESPS